MPAPKLPEQTLKVEPYSPETTGKPLPHSTNCPADERTSLPPFTRPDRVLPGKPENATPEQLREWTDRCWIIRSMFGSGN